MQPAVLLGVGVRLVAGVDDRPLERRLEAHLDLEEVGALAELEAVAVAVLAQADPAGAADDLTTHEERRQVAHDVAEGGGAPDEVVLVRAVGGALVVGVVLVQQEVALPGPGSEPGGVQGHLLPRLVPGDDGQRVGALGGGVLGVGVVDVQARTVGEDHVGQAEVLVGELGRVGHLARHVEAAGVAQRRLLLEVPAGAAGLERGAGVGVDQSCARHHRVRVRVSLHRDAELGLGPHDSPHAHGASVVGPLSSRPLPGGRRRRLGVATYHAC